MTETEIADIFRQFMWTAAWMGAILARGAAPSLRWEYDFVHANRRRA